jgi:hypothetical protein
MKQEQMLIDKSKMNPTKEQLKYRELYNKLNETIGDSQNYKANSESVTEFSGHLEDIEYVCEQLVKSQTYSKGLLKYIDR